MGACERVGVGKGEEMNSSTGERCCRAGLFLHPPGPRIELLVHLLSTFAGVHLPSSHHCVKVIRRSRG